MSSPELSPSSPLLRPMTPPRRPSTPTRTPATPPRNPSTPTRNPSTPPRTPMRRPSEPPTPILRALGSLDDEPPLAENYHECPVCQRHFSLVRFKHRCKACNRKVCNDCSKSRLRLSDMGLVHRDKKGNIKHDRGRRGARVCDPCARSYFATKMEAAPAAAASAHDDAPLRLLRTRHYTVFGFFCLVLLLRVAVPGHSLHANIDKYPLLFFGTDIARQVSSFWTKSSDWRNTAPLRPSVAPPSVHGLEPVVVVAPVIAVHEPNSEDELDTFHLEALVESLVECTSKDTGVNVAAYLDVCAETAKMLVLLGKATAFAASTVAGYMIAIDASLCTNAALIGDDDGVSSWRSRKPPLRRVIDNEVAAGLATIGGKKNPSVSRGVLRLLWFLDFVEATLRLCFVEGDVDDLGPSMSKAYETTLGSRHPWLIRKGVMSALGSVPKRSMILTGMANGKPEADALAHLQKAQELMKRVIDDVRGVLADHELLDLK
ncbi:hypothetical protein SPRG_10883 [Saprolegnia parasitica CBS 223.65]|uniref:FYVE-type domain-containing protein n=1 Tax=Saprolegnia parasitica (strain CBS 223.65) TaxID=695850 RepID=A0A067CC29_SAPPC|nr:hypothetical protein SPRG_10883 [Saprolegnia parasitica CBS 223.65]KDO24096.1 hypothetical protein SPRG_10883 [Saprolegnia parasitica CBS 223.65]|eukprot:XP_012205232.1 hypothetical protein SPRG_10883 [Saprolegnia parasitica CBS 223.65]